MQNKLVVLVSRYLRALEVFARIYLLIFWQFPNNSSAHESAHARCICALQRHYFKRNLFVFCYCSSIFDFQRIFVFYFPILLGANINIVFKSVLLFSLITLHDYIFISIFVHYFKKGQNLIVLNFFGHFYY